MFNNQLGLSRPGLEQPVIDPDDKQCFVFWKIVGRDLLSKLKK